MKPHLERNVLGSWEFIWPCVKCKQHNASGLADIENDSDACAHCGHRTDFKPTLKEKLLALAAEDAAARTQEINRFYSNIKSLFSNIGSNARESVLIQTLITVVRGIAFTVAAIVLFVGTLWVLVQWTDPKNSPWMHQVVTGKMNAQARAQDARIAQEREWERYDQETRVIEQLEQMGYPDRGGARAALRRHFPE